jgi:hypothetical protein
MGVWRRSARKIKGRNYPKWTITAIMEVGKNILEITEEKRLPWFGYVKRMPGNRLPRKILELEAEKKGKTQREMDTRSKTKHDKPWTDRRGY